MVSYLQTKSPLSGWLSRCSVAGSRPAVPAHSGSSQCGTMGRPSPSRPRRAVRRPGAIQCHRTGRDFPTSLDQASRKPAGGLPALWTRNSTRPALDGLWRPSLRLSDPCWVEECEGRDTCSVQPASLSAPCSTLAGGRALIGRDAPRPDASWRLRRAAEGKGGASWRRDRSRAQPRAGPLGPSMASTARTHPLPAASTVAPTRVVHRTELSTAQSSTSS